MTTSTPFSIIIKTRNNFTYLKGCLLSIRQNLHPAHEIIVVCNGCDASEVAAFKDSITKWKEAGDIKIIELEKAGLCTATNAGVATAKYDWVWLFDDDYYVGPGADNFISKIPLVEKTVYSNVLIEPGLQPVSPFLIEYDCGKNIEEFNEDEFNNVASVISKITRIKSGEVSYPVLLEKSFYEEVGGLDPRFDRAYANDPDFWYRLANAGGQFIRLGSSVFYHFSGRSNNAALKETRKAVELACNKDFIRKWGEMFNYSFGSKVQPGVKYPSSHDKYLPVTLAFISNRLESLMEKINTFEPYFDKVMIVWTGSTGVVQPEIEKHIANQQSAIDISNKFQIIETPFIKDFAAIRNAGVVEITTPWVFWLDDDEFFDVNLIQSLRNIIYQLNENPHIKCVGIPRVNIVDGKRTPVYPDYQYRLTRAGVTWSRPVHEIPTPLAENKTHEIVNLENLNLIHIKSSDIFNKQQELYDTIAPGAGSKRM